MLAHGLVDRPTYDLDLFGTDPAALAPFATALTEALTGAGMSVSAGRVAPGYRQLIVTVGDETVLVELAHDARLWPASTLAAGAVLSIEELAADKTLALFGRAEPRDLVDVAALAASRGSEQLLVLAAAKDTGFDRAVLADAIRFAAAQPDSRFQNLGLSPADLTALREWAKSWYDELVAAGPTTSGRAGQTRVETASELASRDYPASPTIPAVESASLEDRPPRRPPSKPPEQGRSRS